MPNVLQQLNDSAAGVVIGTALHTLGAIGLLGGLVGYIAWHRHLHRGHHHVNVLNGATFLAYISILINLVGGFMRTYETGHPSITDFGTSGWVRAITIKHLFLFVGMGAAIYLFEKVAPRHLKAMKEGTLPDQSMTGHALGVLLVALGIMVAAVLGAVSTVLPIAAAADGGGMDDGHDDHVAPDVYHNATGQLLGNAVTPARASSSFEVPAGSSDIEANLVWTPTVATLAIEVRDPDGDLAFQASGNDGDAAMAFGKAPGPGRWTYAITSPDPVVNAQWELVLRMPQVAGNQSFMTDTIVIPPAGQGIANIYEVNTVSPLNGTLFWDWSAGADIHFDVHSHFDEEVQYPVTMTAAGHSGSYTNDRAGGYSYLWENTGNLPVTVTYRIWGDWTFDSVFPA